MAEDSSIAGTPRLTALHAIENTVLASLDREFTVPLMFGEVEIPEWATAADMASMALSALCTIAKVSGMRASRISAIFRDIEREERAQ